MFELTADFSVSFCIWKSHGTVSYSVGNSSLYLPLSIGVDNAGRPKVTSTSCRFEVDDSSLIFYGKHAWFFNFLARTFKGAIYGFFQKMICSAFRTEVNKGAAKYFGNYQVNKTVGPLFTVDYRLVSPPSFNASYMEVSLRGETFWTKKRSRTSVPVPQLPPFVAKNRTVYFMLTDYVFNTLGQVAFRQELLQKVLTYKDLPSDQQYFFNTTCPRNLCFGKLIAQTAVMFPNSRAELHIKTSERPVFTISQSSLDISFSSNIIFYMRRPNGNSTYIFAIKTKLDIQLHALSHDIPTKGRLTAAINSTSLSVGILNSAIGAINLNLLNTLMDTIISLYVRPQLNKLGAFGFPLPVWSTKTRFQNIQIIQAQNALIIGVDVKYVKDEMLWNFGHHIAGFNYKEENPQRSFQVVDGNSGQRRQPIKL
ncbi:bactericidal permeability-increasing protein-like [Liolophura sinensis]|uniref:bactericidal permeability-increasing protein-like n=1 Tax=Liolophura sinensis TaxID=3198878 RepID=UPI003158610E